MKRNYMLINQEPNLCVISILKMILQRNNLYVIESNDTYKKFFKTTEYIDSKGRKNEYIAIQNLNSEFFIPNKYPLQETYHSAIKIEKWGLDLSPLKNAGLNTDNDVIIYANYKLLTTPKHLVRTIYNENREDINNIIHVFLLYEYINDDNIVLICPETEDLGGTTYITVSLEQIETAITYPVELRSLGYSIIKKLT